MTPVMESTINIEIYQVKVKVDGCERGPRPRCLSDRVETDGVQGMNSNRVSAGY